jgi:hypothetical protein
MALDRDTLKGDLLAAMNTAKDESWTAEQVAAAMADAIDAHARRQGHRRKARRGVVYPQSADGSCRAPSTTSAAFVPVPVDPRPADRDRPAMTRSARTCG